MTLKNLIKKGGLRGLATATVATAATVDPKTARSVARVATVAVATDKNAVVNGPTSPPAQDWQKSITKPSPDPTSLFYPNSDGMSDGETARLAKRTIMFARHGLTHVEAEKLAFKTIDRDRDLDDRRYCLECASLARAGGWRCSNWRQAGNSVNAVADDLVMKLQRCPGFNHPVRGNK